MWLLCVQLISVELEDMGEIYREMFSSTLSDMTSHNISTFFNLYNNLLIKINFILLLPRNNG
jgi:hypothetical protein